MSLISQLVAKAETVVIDSTTPDSVQSGFNLNWDGIIKRQTSFNNSMFISYDGGGADKHLEDQKISQRIYDVSCFIKTVDIETAIENFITVFDGLVLNGDSRVYNCEIQSWLPIRDNLTDVVEIILAIYE